MAIIKPVTAPKSNDPKEIARWYEQIVARHSYQTYAGDPTGNILPRWIGDRCLDTTNSEWYLAHGTAVANWQIIT